MQEAGIVFIYNKYAFLYNKQSFFIGLGFRFYFSSFFLGLGFRIWGLGFVFYFFVGLEFGVQFFFGFLFSLLYRKASVLYIKIGSQEANPSLIHHVANPPQPSVGIHRICECRIIRICPFVFGEF
jgi:hypothetical protein